MVAHWSLRRVQPLQRRVHLAFQYTGEEDPTRYTREMISEDELKDRVAVLLKNIDWRPSLSGHSEPAGVGVLPSGSPRGIPRRVVMSRDSLRSEHDDARNTKI